MCKSAFTSAKRVSGKLGPKKLLVLGDMGYIHNIINNQHSSSFWSQSIYGGKMYPTLYATHINLQAGMNSVR